MTCQKCLDRLLDLMDDASLPESERERVATISYVTGFKQQENWVVFGLNDVKELK